MLNLNRNSISRALIAWALLISLGSTSASAHFVWIAITGDTSRQADVYFGEGIEPTPTEMLDLLQGIEAHAWDKAGKVVELDLSKGEGSWTSKLPETTAIVVGKKTYGVLERGDETFLLEYYAKAGPAPSDGSWSSVDTSKALPLDVTPVVSGAETKLRVTWKGEPCEGAEVTVNVGDESSQTGATDASGTLAIPESWGALKNVRVRFVENTPGELENKSYTSRRHYTTLTFPDETNSLSLQDLAELPKPITSFGGAIIGDHIYAYGGHHGNAHEYSVDGQSNELIQLDLRQPGEWKVLATGPRLQGLALVAHGGKLYRIGGFTAKNEAGDEHDLWSQASCQGYDLKTQAWFDLPELPEPRSSFDAAVVGDTIYVVGGWKMAGEADNEWHESAYAMDLSAKSPAWKAITQPPFQRRALATAAYDGKLYVIGGMQKRGGPTTAVAIYDPATDSWNEGPAIPGQGMEGFGASAFAQNGKLYVSTYGGNLLALASKGDKWEQAQKLDTARFFHRMVPHGADQLILFGGASMDVGKFEHVDVIRVHD